ncbi:MAG TPA: hypothetical protein VH328_12785, partial [Burkholderiaceae bacterium]|nr:hypothetical protein [Burkholderiaceae bacterium]
AGASPALAPGSVVEVGARGLVVACGQDGLVLQEIQRPGGRRQSVASWMQGRSWQPGDRLGQGSSA